MQDSPNTQLLLDLFEEKGFIPNQMQLAAIINTSGPLLLTAGPGSGKTRVLLWRTVNLIVCQNVLPQEIFLCTFTEKASRQLKEGLEELLSLASRHTGKRYDISGMYVGTLHSLCRRMLSEGILVSQTNSSNHVSLMDDFDQYLFVSQFNNWNALLKTAGVPVADDENASTENKTEEYDITEAQLNFYEKINQSFFDTGRSKMKAVNHFIEFANRMAEEDFLDEQLLSFCKKTDVFSETDTALFKMTVEYHKLLKQGDEEKIDFSTLQQKTMRVLEESSNSSSIFKHVIVDEYQDTNNIQQKIYFALAKDSSNICIVGDDDQALYRFRGATVENLVFFVSSCFKFYNLLPARIDLNINYRSRADIVKTYTTFITQCDWADPYSDNYYRIMDKNITSFSTDERPAVALVSGEKEYVAEEAVAFVKNLYENQIISDYNQCAILFPSLRGYKGEPSAPVKAFTQAFEEEGIPIYSPRTKNFLFTDECLATFGIFSLIFDCRPDVEHTFGNQQRFHKWLKEAQWACSEVMEDDKEIALFIKEKQKVVQQVTKDYVALDLFCQENNLSQEDPLTQENLELLKQIKNLHDQTQNKLQDATLQTFAKSSYQRDKEVTLSYAIAKLTSLPWTLLDLFYQLNKFVWFRDDFAMAEDGEDQGLYNMAQITQFISRYMENHSQFLGGRHFAEDRFNISFFFSYLYALFVRSEGEHEDEENPFPKGAVPFLTVHQSKGLEFPVVILGSLSHRSKPPRPLDILVRQIAEVESKGQNFQEPIERLDDFDTMRMFYVALSRPKNFLLLCQFTGKGHITYPAFYSLFAQKNIPYLDQLYPIAIPVSEEKKEVSEKNYSYSADYLPYLLCPRNYMAFAKYGFVPSRTQTAFFTSLIQQTISEFQNYLDGNPDGGSEK